MSQSGAPLTRTSPAFTRRRMAWMPIWLLLTFNVYWIFWLYKTYRQVRRHSATATTITPGRAVGFLFIPLFNIYWFFRVVFDFPRALARMQAECSPAAERLPSGRITGMLMAALPVNILAGILHPGLYVAGEILLATGLILCQRAMNEHTHEPIPQPAPRKLSFAELIGAAGPSLDWGRAAAFAFACFASLFLLNWMNGLVFSRAPGLQWQYLINAAVLAVSATAGAIVAFRYIRNEWLAALAGAGVFGVGGLVLAPLLWGMSDFPSVVTVFAVLVASEFLLLAAIAFFAHLTRSIWTAVLLGVACAEFSDTVLPALFFSARYRSWVGTWYTAVAAWFSHPAGAPDSPSYIGARLTLFQPVMDLQSTLVFTFALWLAYKLWVHQGMAERGAHA